MAEDNKSYRLFYTWQNDRKDTKKIIQNALTEACKILAKEGIELYIDQDTRDRKGKKKIEEEVLAKIRQCDIFVADLTPVMTLLPQADSHKLPKHMPNSNVMFEYGYAQHCKGEDRMISLACLDEENDEHIEFMPFDINHDTITLFKTKEDLKHLSEWIKNIIKDVDEERARVVPEYSCGVLFENQTMELQVKPTYKRVFYYRPARVDVGGYAKPVSPIDVIMGGIPWASGTYMKNPIVQPTTIRAKQKEVYHSYSLIKICLYNMGNQALVNGRLSIDADCEGALFKRKNEKAVMFDEVLDPNSAIWVNDKLVVRKCGTINPGDGINVGDFYVYVPYGVESFHLKWRLSDLNHQPMNGELTVQVIPQFFDDSKADENRDGETEITEYIEEIYE